MYDIKSILQSVQADKKDIQGQVAQFAALSQQLKAINKPRG